MAQQEALPAKVTRRSFPTDRRQTGDMLPVNPAYPLALRDDLSPCQGTRQADDAEPSATGREKAWQQRPLDGTGQAERPDELASRPTAGGTRLTRVLAGRNESPARRHALLVSCVGQGFLALAGATERSLRRVMPAGT